MDKYDFVCSGTTRVRSGLSFPRYKRVPCKRKVKCFEEGKHYCGIHAPSKIARREERLVRRWKEKDAVAQRSRDWKANCEAAGNLLVDPVNDVASLLRVLHTARVALNRKVCLPCAETDELQNAVSKLDHLLTGVQP